MIKENYSLSLNSMVIQQIISILRKNGDNLNKIQKKINKLFCDHYQNEYLFNHDKLREICTTKTKIIDIEKTLQAINLTFKTSQLLKSYEEPKFVSLYPVIKSKYPENLSSVLTGNCFIVTLFGNAKCTKKVLSSLNVKKYFEKYQNDNGISIFGPVNFESFAINEPNSFSYLKDFNEDFPNIFFIEISSHISGTDFEDCCSFLSYISHFVVFCSESADNNSEIENFQKIIQTSYFDLFINCSTKLPINLTENMKFEAEFDIKKLDTNCFRNYLIKEIIQNRLKFIPSEAIIELSKLILEKQIKMIFKEDKEKLKHQIMEKYSNQIRVKSYKFFKQLTQTVDQSSINLNEILSNLLDKTQEFFYVNIYTDFWSNAQIDRASKITRLECKNDFDSLIPVNEYSNQRDDKTKDINELIKDDFYIFIKENPLLSDEEYGKFVYDYYFQNLEKCKSIYLPYLARDIRTTLKKHLPINIRISINHDSFEKAKVSISNQWKTFFIFPTTSCNELFELVKKEFNLLSIPFYIKNNYNDSEVLNDSTCLYQLNSYNVIVNTEFDFTIFYGVFVNKSTKNDNDPNIKTIKISEDFCIDTNDKNAEYKVDFPPDHNGWLDVVFDIKKTSSSSNNANDDITIFLQLNEEDSSFLLKGNSVELQYNQDNEWVTQEDDVFLSFPECDSAMFTLHHCSRYKISKQEMKSQQNHIRKEINDEYIDDKYSRNWNYYSPNKSIKKGNQLYFLPVGFESIGIKCKKWVKNTCIAFYGTRLKNINKIIENGFVLPEDLNEHNDLDLPQSDIKNKVNAIVVSPSIKYASLKTINDTVQLKKGKVYTTKECTVKDQYTNEDYYRLMLLQVRVMPNSFETSRNTTQYFANDIHFSDKIIEWRIEDPDDVYPYRILYKLIPKDVFLTSYIEDIKRASLILKFLDLDSEKMLDILKSKKKIGDGGSSTVYRIKNFLEEEDKKYLAIKVYNDNFIKKPTKDLKEEEDSESEEENEELFDKVKYEKITRETIIANSLHHKNIVKFYRFFKGNKNINPAIITEYCISNLKKRIKLLENKNRVTAIFEICSVMACIHAADIIYHDLKPENVLMNSEDHIKLCDFGTSIDVKKDKLFSITNHEGTKFLMAPEYFMENTKIDEKVDVYSFCILMYYILTKGEYPKPKDTKSAFDNFENLKLPPEINKLSQKIIKSCWSLSPQKRPSFSDIITMIVDNDYLIIDGIEKQVPEILRFLGLN